MIDILYHRFLLRFGIASFAGMITDAELARIASTPLFRGIPSKELTLLLDHLPCRIRTYERGELFAAMGDRIDSLHLILHGTIEAKLFNARGKFVLVDRLSYPRVIAPAIIYAIDNRYPVDVEVTEDLTLLSIPSVSFLKAMRQQERLLLNFLQAQSEINRFLSRKLSFLSLHTVREKIGVYLLGILDEKQRKEEQPTVHLSESKQSIADTFGIARQSLMRVMTEMVEEGVIEIDGRNIRILRKDLLVS